MDTATKATLAVMGIFLALIVGLLIALGQGVTCPTGETTQRITYQNSPNGDWVTEPLYEDCGAL
jgi:hypothetical protein